MKNLEMYRDFEVYQDYPNLWYATHKDYDGPEDPRSFLVKTRQEAIEAVDDYWAEEAGEGD